MVGGDPAPSWDHDTANSENCHHCESELCEPQSRSLPQSRHAVGSLPVSTLGLGANVRRERWTLQWDFPFGTSPRVAGGPAQTL